MSNWGTSVPARYVEFLLDQADQSGCDVPALLDALQLDRQALNQNGYCSAFNYGRLYQRIMRESDNEWFAMFGGGRVPLGAFRLMCFAAAQCSDLEQAIRRCGEFAEICKGLRVRTLVDNDAHYARLRLGPIRSVSEDEFQTLQSSSNPNFIVLSLLASHRFNSWLSGKNLAVKELRMSVSRDDVVFDLRDFGAGKIIDQCDVNELVYDANILSTPVIQNQDSALEFARTAPYHLITEDPAKVKLGDKVRSILNRDVGHAMPGAEEVASMLHMSATTLRRHLMAEDTSFQTLKDECRLEAALHYLSCPDLTNTMVAERLGFDEPSAFFRSFKKWTGETPGNYRSRMLKHAKEH